MRHGIERWKEFIIVGRSTGTGHSVGFRMKFGLLQIKLIYSSICYDISSTRVVLIP
jgi:hypothetical protein